MRAESHHTALLLAGVSAFLQPTGAAARPQPLDQVRAAVGNTPLPDGDYAATARFLLNANDVIGALGAWRQAAIAEPGSVTVLNGIAACYDRLGRHDLARRYYDEALAIDPQSTLIHGNLGWSLYRQQRDAEAIPWLQRAAAGSDPEIAAVSRRLLALIAARLRDQSIAAERRAVVVAMAAPAARIETAANGEARLVLNPVAPAPELVARLGDDAALTIVTRASSAADEAAVNRQNAAQAASTARAANAARPPLASPAAVAMAATAITATPLPGAALPRAPAAAVASRPETLALATPTPAARRSERRSRSPDRVFATLTTAVVARADRSIAASGARPRSAPAGATRVDAVHSVVASDVLARATAPTPLPADRRPAAKALAQQPPARPAPLAALTLAWSLFGRFDADTTPLPALSRLTHGWTALLPGLPQHRQPVAAQPAMMFDRLRRQLARMA